MFKWSTDGIREVVPPPQPQRVLGYRSSGINRDDSPLAHASLLHKCLAGAGVFLIELVLAAIVPLVVLSLCSR